MRSGGGRGDAQKRGIEINERERKEGFEIVDTKQRLIHERIHLIDTIGRLLRPGQWTNEDGKTIFSRRTPPSNRQHHCNRCE